MFNDAVAVVLFQTMTNLFTKDSVESEVAKPAFVFEVMLDFSKLVSISIALGIVFGVICTLLIKHCRFISHSAINESALFLSFALLSYYVSELLEASAIATLLVTSIVLSHYAFYNLSP